MSQIHVSVVLPAHNEAGSIERAVRSLLPLGEDEEIVLVDDHSTDGTAEVANGLGVERLRVLPASGRGLVDALNFGIEEANGAWIARADADDLSLPGRLRYQRRLLKETGADLCTAPAEIVRQDGSLRSVSRPCLVDSSWPYFLQVGPSMMHGTVMMRRRMVQEVGGYRRDAFPAEDYDLWVRLFEAGFTFVAGTEAVYRYTLNAMGISATRRSEQRRVHEEISRHARRAFSSAAFKPSELLRVARNESGAGGGPYRRNVANTFINARRRVADITPRESAALALAAHVVAPISMARLHVRRLRR